MTVQIEEGVPIPEPVKKVDGLKYPIKDLQVGQSFLTKCKERHDFTRIVSRLSSTIRYHKKTHPEMKDWQFVIRSVEGGVRIWRTE